MRLVFWSRETTVSRFAVVQLRMRMPCRNGALRAWLTASTTTSSQRNVLASGSCVLLCVAKTNQISQLRDNSPTPLVSARGLRDGPRYSPQTPRLSPVDGFQAPAAFPNSPQLQRLQRFAVAVESQNKTSYRMLNLQCLCALCRPCGPCSLVILVSSSCSSAKL